MKKKVLAVILAVSCSLSLAGCGAFEAGLQAALEEAGVEVSGEFDSEKESKESKEESKESKEESKESKEESKESKEESKESKEESKESKEESKESKEESKESKEEGKESKEETKESIEKPNTQSASGLADSWDSFQISINGEVYKLPMWYSDFEALGWEYDGDPTDTLDSNEYSMFESWEKDGVEIETRIANLSMNKKPYSECIIAGISVDSYDMKGSDAKIVLPGGITYGVSTADDVKAAYGTPKNEYIGEYSHSLSYELEYHQSLEIGVSQESGVVDSIDLENMVELEGIDNSVSTEVPELVKMYKAPTSVGEEFFSYDIKLEGNYYTLPCPVSELVANGFKIDEENSELAIGSGNYGWVNLIYGDQEYSTYVENYADYATTPENCWLTDIETCSTYEPEFELEIPCGIKLGDKLDDVLGKIKDYDYDEHISGNYIYYTVNDPDADSWGCGYEFTIKEGVVTNIGVSNDEKPEY